MEKFHHQTHPARCIITGPSGIGKSVFLLNLFFYNNNECEKMNIYSPCFHQDVYHELIKCSSNYIRIKIIPIISYEEDLDLVIDEIVNKKISKIRYRNSNI